MTDTTINSYADAVLAVAGAEGQASVVEGEFTQFGEALAGSPELRDTLADTSIPVARRLQVIEDLLGSKASTATISLVSMIVANGRVGDIGAILTAVLERSANSRGEAIAEVRSAVALTDDQKQRLAEALKASTGREVAIRNIVDPSVMGGIVTQIGDTLLDGSVRTRLTQLREAF